MLPRILGTLVLATALFSGSIGLANAGTDNGKGNGGQNNGRGNDGGNNGKGNGNNSAPELDSTALGSGVVLLAGGVLLLSERRRQSK